MKCSIDLSTTYDGNTRLLLPWCDDIMLKFWMRLWEDGETCHYFERMKCWNDFKVTGYDPVQ